MAKKKASAGTGKFRVMHKNIGMPVGDPLVGGEDVLTIHDKAFFTDEHGLDDKAFERLINVGAIRAATQDEVDRFDEEQEADASVEETTGNTPARQGEGLGEGGGEDEPEK